MITKKSGVFCLLLILVFCSFRIQERKNINIVFIGDSITHGARLKDFTIQAPPVFATGYLQKKAGFGNIQFSNQGVSGYTTLDFLPATQKAWPKVIRAANTFYNDKSATLVFSMMLGTNDSAIHGPNGAPATPNTYHDNVKTIIDSLFAHYPDCKIIINHPIWYSDNANNGHSAYEQEGLDRLQSYFPEIDDLVKEYKTIHPKQVFLGDKKAFKYFKKHYLTDLDNEKGPKGTFYLHPNEKGAIELGTYWGKAINKALN